MAPYHGRLMIGNRESAKTSTGHGSPLPMLVHGGPGRAGGGEELGGLPLHQALHAADRRSGHAASAECCDGQVGGRSARQGAEGSPVPKIFG